MHIDIKTTVIQPKRNTFKHVAARLGGDRPASRYEEGTFDLQADVNYHYRPLWAPQFEQFDRRRTKVVMKDWYALKDPRQYYYASYNISRAKQQEAVEHNFEMVEKRQMLAAIPADWREKVLAYLLPLRHYEWAANMNNCSITVFGWGAALTAPTCFAMADRLGIAQLISRIGLLLGDNSEAALDEAKACWMEDPAWQGLRHMVEDSLVVEDFFELFVAQNLAMDHVVHTLAYTLLAAEGDRRGAYAISILCSFIAEWKEETDRWVDSVVKTAAAESTDNKALIKGWLAAWGDRALAAVAPLAEVILGGGAGKAAVVEVKASVDARSAKLGLMRGVDR